MRYEILVDRVETPRKCTILPLSYRADFVIKRFTRGRRLPPITSDLFLHMEGPPLDVLARDGALAKVSTLGALDCHWSRVDGILREGHGELPRLARIPEGFVSAYPRKSWSGEDPVTGLATIEALFIAAAFAGTWDETLLAEYHFGAAFLAANVSAFERYGLGAPRW